jgi:hypothetical protein
VYRGNKIGLVLGSAYLHARPWPMLSFLWWYPYRYSNSAVKTLYGCGVVLLVMNDMKIKRVYKDSVGYDQPVLLEFAPNSGHSSPSRSSKEVSKHH